MKKELLNFILILIMFFAASIQVNAADRYYVSNYNGGGADAYVPTTKYYSSYPMKFYNASIGDSPRMTYCLDPGNAYGGNGYHNVDFVVDPASGRKYDLALTKAYQILSERGLNTTSYESRVIGELVFRWITYSSYGIAKRCYSTISGGCTSGVANAYYLFKGGSGGVTQYFSDTSALVVQAKEIYNIVNGMINSGLSYAQLVENGTLWAPQFQASNNPVEGSKQKQEGNILTYTFSIAPYDASKTPEYWKEYVANSKIICSNPTVKCTLVSTVPAEEPAGEIVTVQIDVANWDHKDMGIVFDLPYCDSKSATYNLIVLKPIGSDKNQRMLVVEPNNSCPTSATQLNQVSPIRVPHASISVPTPSDSCSCNTATGVYEYLDKNGNKTTCDPAKEDCTAFKNGKECPGTCERDRSCSIEDNNYYCKDHNGDGLGDECDRDKYVADCLQPECSHPSTDEYYCKDHDGDGGGDKCNPTQYEKDCECPKLKEDCEKNPNGPECEEFNRKCINCSPTVSIPSDCADLQDQDEYNYLNTKVLKGATISDINKKETECNRYVNQVKACVIGKNDAQGASYQDTTKNNSGNVSSGQSKNRYCSIWCEETYDFDLPNAVNSQSGGYFTLSMKITGTRNCYTSGSESSATPINKTQFEKDLEAKQREVINAWNEYSKYRDAVAIYEEDSSSLEITEPGEEVCNKGKEPDDSEDCEEYCDGCDAGDECQDDTTKYKFRWNYTQYNVNGGKYTLFDSYSSGSSPEAHSCNVDPGVEGDHPFQGEDSTYCERNGVTKPVNSNGRCSAGYKMVTAVNYYKKRDNAKSTLIQKINELNQIISEYNSCSGNVSNTNQSDLGNQINTTGWINDMKWEPDIEFTYHENYLDDKEGKFVGNGASSSSEATYCTGDTDGEYNCLSGKNTASNNNNVPTTEVKRVLICSDESCEWKNYNISTAKWVQKTVTTKESFKPQTNFSTFVQYGTIAKNQSGQYTLYTPLPSNAFPVSLVTKTGVFNFNFKFSGIGQSNQDGSVGRLIGTAGKDILSAFNKLDPSLKCTASDNLEGDQTADTNVGYVCHYVNNCDDCEFECEDHNCTFPGCNGDCEFECKNCIFDGNRSSYTFRSVSLSNLNPNDRPVGYNWNSTDNIKARVTQEEIESLGERVYLKPQYSYTLTPQNLTEVRKYNDKAKIFTNSQIPSDYTSRLNTSDAVYCENVEFGGHNYNIKCKSGFLDLVDKMKNVFAKDVYRITADDNAWELFTDTRYCTNGTCLETGIGPAWRIRSDIE